ncbi:pyrimidine 5'-nucleotidase [Denitrobaculum tricleocarpae]|uniref:Pyrimidine 5'-nucleotidase n=1 Tax=Denitrobaculum tricleocarpae TaxID=2591009 RepID=A0A545U1J3_9PROT|nr:pyrimidine 5'-nucleotidase [Denitrobaculum tricleocarpae]TQV83273.1 pyrimidine 5'-nucleotidase [Denitrobaculum tricleocarpae]
MISQSDIPSLRDSDIEKDAVSLSHIDTWIFDLDNTLYPESSSLFDQVDRRMGLFVEQLLGLDPVSARTLQKQYFREHGTTLRGLMTLHDIDPQSYLEFVHEIDVSGITPNRELDRVLGSLPGRKVIFTNASVPHALNVMNQLGIATHFSDIYDIVRANFLPKPARETYEDFTSSLQVDPSKAIFFEDTARNLEPAAAMGMTTVWLETYGNGSARGSENTYVHYRTNDLVDWLTSIALDPAAE